MARRLISSGSPYEPAIGFSRAVVDGRHVAVAGTAPTMSDGAEPPADAYGQTRRVLEIILAALAESGAGPEQVVRTRTFLTDAADWREVGRAHGETPTQTREAAPPLRSARQRRDGARGGMAREEGSARPMVPRRALRRLGAWSETEMPRRCIS